MEKETYTQPRPRRKKPGLIPLFVLLLCAYVFWQAYLMNFNGVDTVVASEGYINDSIVSQGIICRDEYLLTDGTQGSIDYLFSDGERVQKGALIANVYPSQSDVDNLAYLRNRTSLLEDLKASADYLVGSALDVSVARKQLSNNLTSLSSMNLTGNYTGLYDSLNDMTFSLNKIAVATGRAADFSRAQAQVEAEIASVQALISPVRQALYAPRTGYFITRTDGYENIATPENLVSMSFEEGSALISQQSVTPSRDSYGKIITDYKWSLCTYVDTAQCRDLYEGKTVQISISAKGNNFYKAIITKMTEMGEKTLVVAQCTIMDSACASRRLCDCEILFKQYRGIKIPKAAIHFEDGNMGVYVNYSNVVQFKKITPVFEDDNYVVVPAATSADNQVKLYDSIIVKGRNLYDGKYL